MKSNKLLFCFSFAGGTAAFYDSLESCLSPEINVIKLEYSGHGSRHSEPLLNTFEETAKDLYKIISEQYGETLKADGVKYALMGYSMGSISVVEMLKQIICNHEFPMPSHIFLAAHEPKTKGQILEVPSDEVDEYVKRRTIDFGGVPEKLMNNKSFWRMYMPLYKADYLMIARYDFEKLKLQTHIPATIFYSETDTRRTDMNLWLDFFVGQCEFVEYNGKHFFINEHYREMAEVIKNRLECQ